MKKLLFGLLALLIVAIAVLLLLPSFVDWNAHKQELAARASRILGRPVAIEGDLDLTLLPSPVLSAGGIRVAAPPESAGDDLLTIGSLEAEVGLFPLLGGRLEVERIILVEPVARIEHRTDQETPWLAALDPDRLSEAVALNRVTIESGRLIWRDSATGREERFDHIYGQLSAESLLGPAQLVGSLRWRGHEIGIDLSTGRFGGTGVLPVNLVTGLEGTDLTVRFGGLVGADGLAQGRLNVEGSDLLAALSRLAPYLPAHQAAGLGYKLSAAMHRTDDRLEIEAQSLEVGDTAGAGQFVLATEPGSAAPSISLALALTRMDLAQVLGDLDPASLLSDAWQNELPEGLTETLPSMTVNATVDAVNFRDRAMRDARLQAELDAERISIRILSARLPFASEFVTAGEIRIDEDLPRIEMAAEASSSDLRGVLEWLGYDLSDLPPDRPGTFDGQAALAGNARDFQVTGAEISVDQTSLTGGMAYLDRGRPGIGLRVVIDRFNADRYFAEDGAQDPDTETPDGAIEAPGAMGRIAQFLPDLVRAAEAVDANIDARVGAITVSGITSRDVVIDATASNGALTVRNASADTVAGATVWLAGTVRPISSAESFDINVDLSAPAPAPLFRTIGIPAPVPLDRLGPLSVSGRVTGGPETIGVDLDIGVAGGNLSVAGTVDRPIPEDGLQNAAFDLTSRAIYPDAHPLLDLIAPGFQPRRAIGGFDLFARLRGSARDLQASAVQGTIGRTSIAGTIGYQVNGDRPAIDADLRASEIAVEDFLPARRAADRRRPGEGIHWSDEAIDAAFLQTFDAQVDLTASTLAIGDYAVAEPALRAALADGTLRMEGLTGRLFGGDLGIEGTLEAGETMAVSGSFNLTQADLTAAMEAVVGATIGSGTLDFGFTGSASGASEADLVASLNGDGLIAIRDGTIDDLNLAAASGTQTRPATSARLFSGQTTFSAINIPFDADGGILTSSQVRLAGPLGIAEGEGWFSLPDWLVEATVALTLHDQPDGPPIALRYSGPPSRLQRAIEQLAPSDERPPTP